MPSLLETWKPRLQELAKEGRARALSLREWVRPLDHPVSKCSAGHDLLKRWAACPDCSFEQGARENRPVQPTDFPRAFLIRTDAQQKPIGIWEGVARIGNAPDSDALIEDAVFMPVGPVCCECRLDGTIWLSTEGAAKMRVNGKDFIAGAVYDRDEVTIDSVPFIVAVLPDGGHP